VWVLLLLRYIQEPHSHTEACRASVPCRGQSSLPVVLIVSAEEVTSSADILLLLFLLLLLDNSGSSTGSGGGHKVPGVGQEVLELLCLGELEGGAHGDGNEGLEGVVEAVGDLCLGGVVQHHTQGGHGACSLDELALHVILGDVQHIGAEDVTLLVHGHSLDAVGEGANLQLVQQGSLGLADLLAELDQMHAGNHLNLSLVNLGGDVEGLEPRGLAGVAAGRAGLDVDIGGGKSANASGGGHLVGDNNLTDLCDVAVGEHEANVAVDVLQEASHGVLGVLGDEVAQDLADGGLKSVVIVRKKERQLTQGTQGRNEAAKITKQNNSRSCPS